MKLYNRTSISLVAFLGLLACSEPELPTAVPSASSTTPYKANILFVNAAPDAPSLDFFVNGAKVGESQAANSNQVSYSEVSLTSDGRTGSLTANTSIRAKATTGTIGGVLGSSDVILRAANNSTNNFQAVDGARYTIFAIDSTDRPRPVRTLDTLNFASTTYYSPRAATLTFGSNILEIQNCSCNSQALIQRIRKLNGNVIPSYLLSIGTVPLGSTDVGGTRFYLTQDVLPSITTNNQIAVRFVHASPNAPGVFVRMKSTSSTVNIVSTTAVSYIMSGAGGFGTSVGSRIVTSTTSNFTTFTIDPAQLDLYAVEIATDAAFTNIVATIPASAGRFVLGKSYTVYAKGLVGGTGASALGAGIIQHN
jgi:Domain of unknown function (DUF4397)